MGAHKSCKECVGLLVDYLDGKLPPEQEKALDDHFMACPPCIDFVDQYRAGSIMAKRALAEDMPRSLADKLSDFLKKSCK